MKKIYGSTSPLIYIVSIFFFIFLLLLTEAYRQGSVSLWQFIGVIIFLVAVASIFIIGHLAHISLDDDGYVSVSRGFLFGSPTKEYYGMTRSSVAFRFHRSNVAEIRMLTPSEKKQFKSVKSSLVFAPLYIARAHLDNVDKGVYVRFKKPLEYWSVNVVDFNPDKTPLPELYFSLSNPEKFIYDITSERK